MNLIKELEGKFYKLFGINELEVIPKYYLDMNLDNSVTSFSSNKSEEVAFILNSATSGIVLQGLHSAFDNTKDSAISRIVIPYTTAIEMNKNEFLFVIYMSNCIINGLKSIYKHIHFETNQKMKIGFANGEIFRDLDNMPGIEFRIYVSKK